MTTRRKFLLCCSSVAALAGVNAGELLASAGASGDVPLAPLGFQTFSPCVNTTFRVPRPAGATVPLRLVEVEAWRSSRPHALAAEEAGHEKFSLLFRGPKELRLEQDQHTFEHPGIGRFCMFIVPIISRDREHAYYEAVFNGPPAPLPRPTTA